MAQEPRSHRVIWQEEFSLGIAGVDHEHRELVALINQLLDHLEDQGNSDLVADELSEVYTKISAHFALEEHVMHEKRYDQLDDHKNDHERLLDDIRDMMDAFDSGVYASQRADFAERLQEWFGEHFRTKDARLHQKLGH
jgi:hemerythrin